MNGTGPEVLTDVAVSDAGSAESPEVTQLVEQAKGGDADAFAGLVRLHERRVIALGMQMGLSRDDALDACQDAFIKVFRYIHRFRSGGTFYQWLYRIAINAIRDQGRRNRPTGMVSLEEFEAAGASGLTGSGPALHARLEASDLTGKVLKGLATLSRRERLVFVLRDLQEMSTDEIGTILRLSPITVRRHCMTARQKLRDRVMGRDH